MYCTNCGTANVQQAKFCFGCGHALHSGALATSGSLTGLLTHNQELNRRYRIIKQVGNYGESFEANLKPLGFERGLNRLWSQGGLLYVPPIR